MFSKTDIELSDYLVSEKDKENEDYLIAKCDQIIGSLVVEQSSYRKQMLRMRDMRDCVRDPEEFRYLEDNYGIGNSAELKFTSVIRNRIDTLIGILSSTGFNWTVSLTDSESLKTQDFMRNAELLKRIYRDFERGFFGDTVSNIDVLTSKYSKELVDWRSAFEMAGNNLLSHYRDDPDIDLKETRKLILEDIVTVGQAVIKPRLDEYGTIAYPEVLLPENYYTEISRDKKFLRQARRAVYVRYMALEDVLMEYGHFLDHEQKVELTQNTFLRDSISYQELMLIDRYSTNGPDKRKRRKWFDRDDELLSRQRFIRVYETEWIANNPIELSEEDKVLKQVLRGPNIIGKEAYRQDLYSIVRIGSNIYTAMGKSPLVRRSKKYPRRADLTFDGIRFESRGGEPYSLLWKTKDIQDMSDIMIMHRENLVANSGVNGSRMDVAKLPDFLGESMMERVLKAIALKKQGVEVYNSAQNGGDYNTGSNVSSDFRAGVDGTLLSAITGIIDQLDNEATKQTGITPAMMGLFEQRDAVSNVKTGITQTSVVIKNIFDQHDRVLMAMFTSLIHFTQISLKDIDEFVGTFLDGATFRSFTIPTQYLCFSDLNISIRSSTEDYNKLNRIKDAIVSLANTGNADPVLIVRAIKSDSVNELMELVNELAQTTNNSQQTISDLQNQLQQLADQNKKLQSKLDQMDEMELEIKKQEVKAKMDFNNKKISLEQQKAATSKEYNDRIIDLKKEEVKLERDQLILDTGPAREIKNI